MLGEHECIPACVYNGDILRQLEGSFGFIGNVKESIREKATENTVQILVALPRSPCPKAALGSIEILLAIYIL